MKNLSIFIFILLANFGFAQKDHFSVKVDGLGCPFCAYGLEKAFKSIEGVSKISIDLESGMLTYNLPSSTGMTQQQVSQTIESAGYTMRWIQIKRSSGTVEEATVEKPKHPVGEDVVVELSVAGNCDMCRDRIESAALGVKGVKSASWNPADEVLTFAYEGQVDMRKQVAMAIAASGHDTDGFKASSKTYKSLPGCCKYR
jgi:copper chaperone CopZ